MSHMNDVDNDTVQRKYHPTNMPKVDPATARRLARILGRPLEDDANKVKTEGIPSDIGGEINKVLDQNRALSEENASLHARLAKLEALMLKGQPEPEVKPAAPAQMSKPAPAKKKDKTAEDQGKSNIPTPEK